MKNLGFIMNSLNYNDISKFDSWIFNPIVFSHFMQNSANEDVVMWSIHIISYTRTFPLMGESRQLYNISILRDNLKTSIRNTLRIISEDNEINSQC